MIQLKHRGNAINKKKELAEKKAAEEKETEAELAKKKAEDARIAKEKPIKKKNKRK